MKRAFLADADQVKVAEVVRDALKARGMLVTEATHSHMRFEGWRAEDAWSFEKGGYIGVFQHVGEKEAALKARVEATAPARAFWWTVLVETVVIVGYFLLLGLGSIAGLGGAAIDAGTAILVGGLMWSVFLVTFLVYVSTLASSRQAETLLLDGILDALRAHPEAAKEVLSEREHRVEEFEERLEGELAKRKLAGR